MPRAGLFNRRHRRFSRRDRSRLRADVWRPARAAGVHENPRLSLQPAAGHACRRTAGAISAEEKKERCLRLAELERRLACRYHQALAGQTAVGSGRSPARQPGGLCAGDGVPVCRCRIAWFGKRHGRAGRRDGGLSAGWRCQCLSKGVGCVSSLSEFTPKYLRLEMADDIVIVGVASSC